MNFKKNTLRNYLHLLTEFSVRFGEREAESLTSEEILSFLGHLTEGAKQSRKRLRFSPLRAFFTFIINRSNERFPNHCDSPMLRKNFKDYRPVPWKIVEKETVDEISFRIQDQRNRLIFSPAAIAVFRKAPPKAVLHNILCLKETRMVKKYHTVFFGGLVLQIPYSKKFPCTADRQVDVRQYRDGHLEIVYRGSIVALFSSEAIRRLLNTRSVQSNMKMAA